MCFGHTQFIFRGDMKNILYNSTINIVSLSYATRVQRYQAISNLYFSMSCKLPI